MAQTRFDCAFPAKHPPGATRRRVIASVAGLLVPAASCVRAQNSLASPPPVQCADFLASVGVNTHLRYVDSQYNPERAVAKALEYVGLSYVRDAAPDSAAPNADHYRALAAAGVSFCLFWGPRRAMADALRDIAALEAVHPGAVHALEGPNEIKPAFPYGGLTGNPAAEKFMVDLRAMAARDARLRGKPLVSFTSYAPVANDCDFANQHPYPKAGKQPANVMRAVRDRFVGPAGVMPGKPMVFTEFGYHTLVGEPTKPGRWQGVDPQTQAVLLVNALFDAASLGIRRTYFYQLFDGNPDPGPEGNQERHFGLFQIDGAPKPAATALRTLLGLLDDRRQAPRTGGFRNGPISLSVAPPVAGLRLQGARGHDFVALWNESPIWDPDAAQPRTVDPIRVDVRLAKSAPIQAFDIVGGGVDSHFGATDLASVDIGAHPILLRIG